ncbi:putative zinc finger motif, C2HC5-type-domain-containing protein [Emericellopsis atlantica]|uniref:Zinc finger motif, C2HC5-type-domain-containing protein n=1 Tax=Emericellopsis atlantica TaxID=2614577 RepID=A0A9P7ZW63_9HYPO|nr:putative zinc finger motif, C2HC5-type-domain-containing protein [Emericellopsis atlantica]KAG9258770.1 putative zinc finger motif, C2HC5-type-domain-containing protein [Emericellopsis atlantica]
MSLAQLAQLLPLPNEELQQVLDYGASLPKAEAASHFSNLLGNSPQAVEFIASFNSRRKEITAASNSSAPVSQTASASASDIDSVPKSKRGQAKKKKPPIGQLPARQLDYTVPAGKAYNKKDEELEYMPTVPRASLPNSKHASGSSTPAEQTRRERPSAGFLISDPVSKSKPKSTPTSRSSTPKPTAKTSTKITIAGGTPMAGQSTALADLESAIRALEITTNPTLDNTEARKCNCVATRHALQGAAPNCLTCGKVICMKEGLGPCTFCGTPLLKPAEVQAMMRELREERGRELMAVDAKANRRADVAKTPAPFTKPRGNESPVNEAEAKAREHRDKLLNFQAQNARRTTVRDEASDFDVSGAMAGTGGSMWATPEDRAKELKRQQKLMREMEWNAKPDYEKRQQIVSIDLKGRKVTRKMAAIERPQTPESDEENDEMEDHNGPEPTANKGRLGGGAFSGNPLLGALIKPVFNAKGKGPELEGRRPRQAGWRRVQDDLDNNEDVILDGGVRGHTGVGDEPECG